MTVKLLTDTDLNAIYKRQYYQLMQTVFCTYGNVWGMIKKTYGKGGDEVYAALQNTYGGGVGSSADGTLPNPNMEKYLEPNFTWSRVYGNIAIDGLAIEAAKKSEHAFINVSKKATVNKMHSFMRYISGNCLFGDGTGALGQFSGNAAGTASAPVLTILNGISDTYQYRQGYFEVGDDVNINSLTSLFRITAVNHTTREITLSRLSGSDNLASIGAGTHTVYMQNSKDNDPYGLLGIINNSTHYGVAEEYRYQPTIVDAAGAALTNSMIVELIEKYQTDTDVYPNLLVLPPVHYKNFLNLQEDLKRFPTQMKGKPGKSNIGSQKDIAKISYNGISVAAGDGNILVVKNKFMKPGNAYALHTKHIECLGVGQQPGFANSVDGKTFLRMDGKDHYSAFLRWYGEIFINPFYVGAITGLPVT